MAGKTKLRILQAARLLFNVAMVDIAAVLDISPGNLYYHYRGKEQLIPVLFDRFEQELTALLEAPLSSLVSLDECWAYCYLLLDSMYQNRFIHSLDSLRFDTSMRRRFKRLHFLLARQVGVLAAQLFPSQPPWDGTATVEDIGQIAGQDTMLLADNIGLLMLSWIDRSGLGMDAVRTEQFLHEGVYRIFYQIAIPIERKREFLLRCNALRRQ